MNICTTVAYYYQGSVEEIMCKKRRKEKNFKYRYTNLNSFINEYKNNLLLS